MLRRATTLSLFHRQCLSHPLLRPSQDLQSLTPRRSFSTSLTQPKEDEPPISNSQNPSLSTCEAEGDDALPEGERNATGRATSDVARRAPDNAKPGDHASSSSLTHTIHTRTRTRALRPLLLGPTFSSNLLPAIPDPTSSHEQVTETDSSTTTAAPTITLASLPPNTVKSDIRPVFQPFGEIKRIFVLPDGRRADVVFADVHGVKRTLHAYAEQPLCVRGQEIVVFRKHSNRGTEDSDRNSSVGVDNASRGGSYRTSSYTRDWQGQDDGAIFVSNFPPDTTHRELSEALASFGKYERLVMRPDSKYAFFMYSNEDRVEQILRVHQRVPITLRGRSLRIERSENRPYTLTPGPSGSPLEFGKPLDPATSTDILEELKRTVPGWRGSYEPSRVIWIGRLPTSIPREALTNFWSRLGCVVEVRTSPNGFAHVEFASTEEALRAARKGAPHGFRYKQRLLDVDFAPWIFYIGPGYRVVYISGWPASNGRRALLQWTYDIPNIIGMTVLPPFRGEKRSDPRGAFLQFGTIDDARTALQMLDGRAGPGGETLHMGLSRLPAVHPNRLWRWAYEEEGGAATIEEDEWEGLGFGTGEEEQGARGGRSTGFGFVGRSR